MHPILAPLRFPLFLACLLAAVLVSSSTSGRAQDWGARHAGSSGQVVAANTFVRDLDNPQAERSGRPEITAFSKREVAFGLFVLIVGFLGVLVFLPAGLKSEASRRHGHPGT